MKNNSTLHPPSHREWRIAIMSVMAAIVTFGLPSCGPKESAPAGGGTPGGKPPTGSAVESKGGTTPPAKPAPVVVVPKPINLKKISLFDGGELLGLSPANLSYKVKGDVKPVYDFHRRQFIALGWKETPESSVTEQYASGTFTGAGYKISASVSPTSTPGELNIMLHNHGDVDLAKLPLPPGTTPVYVGPLSAMHVTEAAVAETTDTVRKLLMDGGWEPHGNEGDSWHFKKGFNRVSAMISSALAQGGKTMINYGSELMTGDLPAPPDATDVRYLDTRQELTFETGAEKDAVVDYYKEKLAKTGFKNDDEKTYRIDDYHQMVFRNPGGDVIFLKVYLDHDGKRNVSLGCLTAEDIVEMDAKYKAKGKEAK